MKKRKNTDETMRGCALLQRISSGLSSITATLLFVVSYRNGLSYLESKTKVLELYDRFGARVAVCPEWSGRVMTSTGDGLDGTSHGLIHVAGIEAEDPALGFFGGEDQFSLSPESGPLSLYDEPKPASSTARHHVHRLRGAQEGPFMVDTVPPDPIRMRRAVRITNLVGATFDFDIVRTVRLLSSADVDRIFGNPVAVSLEQADVSFVGFETINTLHNHGSPLVRKSGLVSMRIRSMFNSGQETVAIVPFRVGNDAELGPSVCADFFGTSPHGRLRILPQAALLRADCKFRCQVGVSRKRVLPFLGAVDFRIGLMTLTTFSLPQEPWEHDYLSNAYCETADDATTDFISTREYFQRESVPRQTNETKEEEENALDGGSWDKLYSGEVVRAYNHGPSTPGETPTARYYEFDVFSPAKELNRGESLTHHQFTAHINADNQTLAFIARTVFGVDYDHVYDKIIR